MNEHVVQVQEPGCECCTMSRHRRLDCLDYQMGRWERGAMVDKETLFCITNIILQNPILCFALADFPAVFF